MNNGRSATRARAAGTRPALRYAPSYLEVRTYCAAFSNLWVGVSVMRSENSGYFSEAITGNVPACRRWTVGSMLTHTALGFMIDDFMQTGAPDPGGLLAILMRLELLAVSDLRW